jgi:Tax1-binding protein 1
MDMSVNLDPTMATASMKVSKTSQVQVIFRNVEETYPIGVDIQCSYSISGSLEVGSRDWVGLYRVGWRSQSDYYYYDWSPLPPDYVKGKSFEGKIIFPAHKLPKDDGEFYQFCYVTSAGQVRGASTPFQFRQTSVDDLIEIEDENGELLVIKTKTALLEEKLKKANDAKLNMKQQIQTLENERNLLLATEHHLQRKLQQQKEEEQAVREKLEEVNDLSNEQKLQLEHLQSCISSSQEKMEILNQEKSTMEKRLDENDAYIVSLQEKIKALVNEKDALTGRIRSLEDEGEQLRGFVMENDRLKTRLMEEEISGARVKKEVERMEDEIQDQQMRFEKQLQVSSDDRETIEILSERLRNAEDKLSAAEHCKMMLNEEVLTVKQAFEKLSSDLEESKVEADSARKTLCVTEKRLNAEIKLLSEEKHTTQEKLDTVTKESDLLLKELGEVRVCLEEKSNKQRSEAEGSSYALEMAQATLKERYTKMSKKLESNQRTLEQALCHVHELEMNVEDQKQEIDHLMDRLRMAEETYKEKYIECEVLETKLFKQKLAFFKRIDSREVASSGQKSPKSDGTTEVIDSKVLQELEYAKLALEKCHAKADKYKRLYIDEKRQTDQLLKKLIEKDEDFNLLRDVWVRPCGPPGDAYLRASEKSFDLKDAGQKSSDAASLSSMRSMESFDAIDGPETGGIMQAPLRPLPPPMLPAKIGQSSAMLPDDVSWNMTDVGEMEADEATESDVKDMAPNSQLAAAAANIEAERFEDAPGEPQKTCPVCSRFFSIETPEGEYLEHIDAHFVPNECCGAICPICSKLYPQNSNEFTIHVNSHFDA